MSDQQIEYFAHAIPPHVNNIGYSPSLERQFPIAPTTYANGYQYANFVGLTNAWNGNPQYLYQQYANSQLYSSHLQQNGISSHTQSSMKRIHATTKGVLLCNLCPDRILYTFLELQGHVYGKNHRNKQSSSSTSPDFVPFTCLVCNKNFLELSLLKIHTETDMDHKQKAHEVSAVVKCEVCSKQFNNNQLYEEHLNSSRHKDKVANVQERGTKTLHKFSHECKVCETKFTGIIPYEMHMKSKKHTSKLQEFSQPVTSPIKPEPKSERTKEEQIYCALCKCSCVNKYSYEQHLVGKQHKLNETRAFCSTKSLVHTQHPVPQTAIVISDDDGVAKQFVPPSNPEEIPLELAEEDSTNAHTMSPLANLPIHENQTIMYAPSESTSNETKAALTQMDTQLYHNSTIPWIDLNNDLDFDMDEYRNNTEPFVPSKRVKTDP